MLYTKYNIKRGDRMNDIIPDFIRLNTKCLSNNFRTRSEKEIKEIIESRNKIYKLFKSFIISKDFFNSKSMISIEHFIIFLILLPIEKRLYQYITTYRYLNNHQSILNFQDNTRIILI